ncbi:MAG TPA: hypothetical protein DCR21_02730 [Succinivibrionaceae bacterium]|nr:hypothetical protein [Succinivibrionaceae bacterium]
MLKNEEGSKTAEICAWVRATHSRELKGRIFNDSLAASLIGRQKSAEVARMVLSGDKSGRARSFLELSQEFFPIPISRSAWAETEVRNFAAAFSEIQYVILGAGLDTFAWRNQQQNIRTFEVDHPYTQKSKLYRLKSLQWNTGKAVFVPVDFAKDSLKAELLKRGFDPEIPAVFTILGVAYYLPVETFSNTLKDIASLMQAPARVLFDFRDDVADAKSSQLSAFTESLGEPMAAGYNVTFLKRRLRKLGYYGIFHMSPLTIGERYFKNRCDGLAAYRTVHFIKAAV